MLCSQLPLQVIAPPSNRTLKQAEKWNFCGTKRRKISCLAAFWWRRKWKQGRVSAVYAKACMYTFGWKSARKVGHYWQTSFTSFATPTHRCCDADQSEMITQLITEMTAHDLLPLCFVEGKGFRRFMLHIEPEYTVLSRTPAMSWLELSLMFSNVRNLNNKQHNVLHITIAFKNSRATGLKKHFLFKKLFP